MEQRKSFLLRVNPALWAELETWAQEDLRSVNAQIEFLLREAVLRRRGKRVDIRSDPSSASGEKQ